jgi:hypothetical protein
MDSSNSGGQENPVRLLTVLRQLAPIIVGDVVVKAPQSAALTNYCINLLYDLFTQWQIYKHTHKRTCVRWKNHVSTVRCL